MLREVNRLSLLTTPMVQPLLLVLFLLCGCSNRASSVPPASTPSSPASDGARIAGLVPVDSLGTDSSRVRTGAYVLARDGFRPLQGKRVGLIVNHTSRVGDVHLIDLVARAPGVRLTALFGPEHGLRGEAAAGEKVSGGRDERTGVRIYSLYGNTRKPTPDMLREVDVLVFDIQDVGSRFYTYISTMGLAMQAAAEVGKTFVVLDRPNPLGGEYVAGFLMEPEHESFVGQYRIPIAHGLTVGELARMIKGAALLPGLDKLKLTVVPMEGWTRDLYWSDTGLPWIPPSPNIPDPHTALVYAGTCLFEATSASEGRGTEHPFRWVGAITPEGARIASTLTGANLPGVVFKPVTFTPRDLPGRSTDPKLEGKRVNGIEVTVTDEATFLPVETGVHLLAAYVRNTPPSQHRVLINRAEWLAKLSGTNRLHTMLLQGTSATGIIESWKEEVASFRRARMPYLLYR